MDKTYEDLVKELMYHVMCVHIDMGGKHKYSLTMGAHDIIRQIKLKIWEEIKDA
jgi:hypothetical protein